MAAGLALALAPSPGASAGVATGFQAEDLASQEMLAAVARDFGLSTDQALARLANDLQAMAVTEDLAAELGSTSGGTWLDANGNLVAATTTFADVAAIRAAGAEPRVVTYSLDTLDGVVEDLNGTTAPDAADVHMWYADVTTNRVVIEVATGAEAVATEWLEASGVDPATVRIVPSAGAPELLFDIVGGWPYFTPTSRCSIGFAVTPRGYLTAGHCGTVGTPTTGHNGAAQGSFQRRTFPGAGDRAYVAVNSNWRLHALVSRYNGTFAPVNGRTQAPVGAAVCRSGSTNGYTCGTILAHNQSVSYPQGTVTGLTLGTPCAGPGDSGGSVIAAGINAQGMTSGGSGFCGSGQPPRTFWEPVNRALNAFGLTLVTR